MCIYIYICIFIYIYISTLSFDDRVALHRAGGGDLFKSGEGARGATLQGYLAHTKQHPLGAQGYLANKRRPPP